MGQSAREIAHGPHDHREDADGVDHSDRDKRADAQDEKHDELNRRAFADTLPRFALRPAALDHARYARFAAFLEAQGLIKPPPPVETYAKELSR